MSTPLDWLLLAFVVFLGLSLGSFVNALEWRLRRSRKGAVDDEEGEPYAGSPGRVILECLRGAVEEVADWLKWPVQTGRQVAKSRQGSRYSILNGRSMCPHCKHELAATDLVPVFSWLALRGRCRYCKKPISWQYPLVELITALVFTGSYLAWPEPLSGINAVMFGLWLLMVTGFVALAVYDAKWHNLPNEILHPLLWVAVIMVGLQTAQEGVQAIITAAAGVLVMWGLFFTVYCAGEVLNKALIGYGDVRLAVLLGLLAGGALPALAILFFASLGGTIMAVVLLATGRANRQSHIPYGPFLLAAGTVFFLFGERWAAMLSNMLGVA